MVTAYSFKSLSLVTYLLFLPQNHLHSVHRHHNADFLLLDALGLEFILKEKDKGELIRIIELHIFIVSFLFCVYAIWLEDISYI